MFDVEKIGEGREVYGWNNILGRERDIIEGVYLVNGSSRMQLMWAPHTSTAY